MAAVARAAKRTTTPCARDRSGQLAGFLEVAPDNMLVSSSLRVFACGVLLLMYVAVSQVEANHVMDTTHDRMPSSVSLLTELLSMPLGDLPDKQDAALAYVMRSNSQERFVCIHCFH